MRARWPGSVMKGTAAVPTSGAASGIWTLDEAMRARRTLTWPTKEGNDADTVLLMHCDGTNGSTTFTDSSASAHTMTARGNGQISTAQSVFGGASYLGDGTGDAVDTPDSTAWDFPGDFTLDTRLRFAALPAAGQAVTIMGQYVGGGAATGALLQFRRDGVGDRLALNTNDTERGASSAWTPSVGVWYAIAFERFGTSCQFFVDGALQGSPFTFGTDLSGNTAAFVIGALLLTGSYIQSINGNLDEIRVSKRARYQGQAYTPLPYPFS